MIKELIDNQFVRYVIASAIALCVGYGSYWVIAATTNLALPTAAAMSCSVGLIVAYFLLAERVFRGGWLRNKQRLEILLFALSGGLGILVTYAVVAIYLLLLGADVHLSKITAVAFSFVIIYFFESQKRELLKLNWLKHKSALIFGIATLSFSSISAWLVAYVPSNMDEFLPYHRIACSVFPNAIDHVFRESCTAYPVKLLGFDFFLSYSYVGYTSNLLYLPFYSTFPTPVSHHLLGALILMLFSLLLVKAFLLPKLTAVIPLIYFPLLFQVIHDQTKKLLLLMTALKTAHGKS